MNNCTVTVTTSEGTFVYIGSREDDTPNWKFLRPGKDGKPRPGRVPRRWARILNKEQKQNATRIKGDRQRDGDRRPEGAAGRSE